MPRLLLSFLCLFTITACASIERIAIPKSNLADSSFQSAGKVTKVDHRAWGKFLKANTVKDNADIVRVKYADISPAQKQQLKDYIKSLSSTDHTKLSKDAQLAYWANLYNAQTVDVILDNYPVESIRKIKDRPFDLGPWEDKRLTVNGKELSLHDIEHGIVRPLWSNEPRIHYILNCAAAGCPNLGQKAYTGQNIQQSLHDAAIAYVNDPRGVTVSANGRIIASKIYSWYKDDFGGSNEAILNHIRKYADDDLKAALRGKKRIAKYEYDWSLNDATATP
ncbi:DUF547 domain-containing protein [Amylibacter sp. SFDW26]|uniref:DUF547 domain-containing protein n=1 Tax=Amylibacter sp. SFDW26 TaxID=2652722 RepID=UPI001262479B|nr:DUF547 domain-containing protein [Amylibacter sp. SFDW26]KAB7615308.1 DUF547 domain-containing protein [Amylibacter sp. SFDW26]